MIEVMDIFFAGIIAVNLVVGCLICSEYISFAGGHCRGEAVNNKVLNEVMGDLDLPKYIPKLRSGGVQMSRTTSWSDSSKKTITVTSGPLVAERAPDGLCANCKIRPGTETWVGEGGTLALVHGFSAQWCLRCCLEAQIEYCTKAAERLPDLKRQLEEACR